MCINIVLDNNLYQPKPPIASRFPLVFPFFSTSLQKLLIASNNVKAQLNDEIDDLKQNKSTHDMECNNPSFLFSC